MKILLNKEESINDLILQLNYSFTESEKESCLPTINRIIDLANFVRAEGIIALEDVVEQEPNVFLKTALLLVLNGNAPEVIKDALQNMIIADNHIGFQLLDRFIIAEGVLAMQRWENPDTIAFKLNSLLGEAYVLKSLEPPITRKEKNKRYFDFLKALQDKTPLPECVWFEKIFLQIDDKAIQLVIHCVDNEDLILALYGCGVSLIGRVLDNVSAYRCLRICDKWDFFNNFDNQLIVQAQKDIVKVFETLEDMGEITRKKANR